MSQLKHLPLRKIAETELLQKFGELDTSTRNDLATSLVRQWITNDGHAGLVTATHQFWFQLMTNDDRVEVGFRPGQSNWGRILVEQWHVAEQEITALLHQLNLSQSARCRTTDGHTIRLRVYPRERTVQCEVVTDAVDTEL